MRDQKSGKATGDGLDRAVLRLRLIPLIMSANILNPNGQGTLRFVAALGKVDANRLAPDFCWQRVDGRETPDYMGAFLLDGSIRLSPDLVPEYFMNQAVCPF